MATTPRPRGLGRRPKQVRQKQEGINLRVQAKQTKGSNEDGLSRAVDKTLAFLIKLAAQATVKN